MLRYQPAKAQIWGHKLGRLSSAQVLERATRFLREKTIYEIETAPKLTMVWEIGRNAPSAELIDSITRVIAATPEVEETFPAPGGMRAMQVQLKPEEVPFVAARLDEIPLKSSHKHFQASCSSQIAFAWKDSPQAASTPKPFDGMFGIHLGSQRGVTTMFTFRDEEHYEAIKKYLIEIELVELSDKHLKAAGFGGKSKRASGQPG